MDVVKENNSVQLADYDYDLRSRRTRLTYGNGASIQTPNYSVAGDLQALTHQFTASSPYNVTFSYGYTAAHQLASVTHGNTNHEYLCTSANPCRGDDAIDYAVNELNQYVWIDAQSGDNQVSHSGAAPPPPPSGSGGGGTGGGGGWGGCRNGICQAPDATLPLPDLNSIGLSASTPQTNMPSPDAQAVAYDAKGNLISDGHWTFSYDAENRLISANEGGTTVTYGYDPLGQRVRRSVGSVNTYFLGDAQDEEIAEYNAAGTLTYRFIPGPAIDQPIAQVTAAGVISYFHKDRLGSVIAMSSTNGQVTEGPYRYDAYGNGAPTTGTPFKYTGRRLDPETGLYYYRARYYSTRIGRFLQVDPIGTADDVNLYAYVKNSPLSATDPSGLFGMGCQGSLCDEYREIDRANGRMPGSPNSCERTCFQAGAGGESTSDSPGEDDGRRIGIREKPLDDTFMKGLNPWRVDKSFTMADLPNPFKGLKGFKFHEIAWRAGQIMESGFYRELREEQQFQMVDVQAYDFWVDPKNGFKMLEGPHNFRTISTEERPVPGAPVITNSRWTFRAYLRFGVTPVNLEVPLTE